MMDSESHPRLPSESTIARETEEAIESPFCETWIQQARAPSDNVTRIQMEWFYSPYRSREIENHDSLIHEIQGSGVCSIVYVRSFTNSGHDFVYCVPGRKNLTKFFGGTYGARNYEGPILAALVVLADVVLNEVSAIDWRNFEKVSKSRGKLDHVRWRYLFATAKRAWNMMTFYAWGLPTLEDIVCTASAQQQKTEPEDSIPDPISYSGLHAEVQKIAIHQNVEILKRKSKHHDRVFEYLEAEMNGRCRRQGNDELTKQEQYLLERLRDNADDFQILYDAEKESGDEAKTRFDAEEESRLRSQRDEIIRRIEDLLALPITVYGGLEDLDLPALKQPSIPVVRQATRSTPNPEEGNALDDSSDSVDTEPSEEEQAKLILKFAEFTGSTTCQSEGCLFAANWDLERALSYLYEDQPEKEPPALPPVDTSKKEQLATVLTFRSLANSNTVVAESYLHATGWDVGLAVSTFFDNGEASKGGGRGANESPDTLSSKSNTSIQEKHMEDTLANMRHTTKRSAPEPFILDPGLKKAIRNRIEELEAKIDATWKAIENLDNDSHEVIMQDATGGKSDSNSDREATAAPTSVPHVTGASKDLSHVVTLRTSLSHAGLPIVLDEAGNVVSYCRPQGTPYQQYLDMRWRLQVQHYGHGAIPSDKDPHRGIPIRERCPPPFAQESLNDSSSSFSFPSFLSSSDSAIAPSHPNSPTSQEPVHIETQRFLKTMLQEESKQAAMIEIAELVAILAASEAAETTKADETTESATQLEDKQLSEWTASTIQAIESIASFTLEALRELVPKESAPEDSALSDANEDTESAISNQAMGVGKPTSRRKAIKVPPIKKPKMNVRRNLEDEQDLSTSWDDVTQAEQSGPRVSMVVQGEPPAIIDLSDPAEDKKHVTGVCDEQAGEAVREEEKVRNALAEDQKKKAEGERKKDLFVSKQEDAWDGYDSDAGNLELESEPESDGDAEDEEEVGKEQVEEQQERGKPPRRMDEKMENGE